MAKSERLKYVIPSANKPLHAQLDAFHKKMFEQLNPNLATSNVIFIYKILMQAKNIVKCLKNRVITCFSPIEHENSST